MSESYQTHLYLAWVGERQGEVFFDTLAALTADQQMKHKWTVLAELERRVGVALERIVKIQHNESNEVEAIEVESMVAAAKKFTSVPLAQGLASIVKVIDVAVEEYITLRTEGPEEHAVELDVLARHEIALQTFVRREVAQRSTDSLEEAEGLVEELRLIQS